MGCWPFFFFFAYVYHVSRVVDTGIRFLTFGILGFMADLASGIL